jgi:hypothetical protein
LRRLLAGKDIDQWDLFEEETLWKGLKTCSFGLTVRHHRGWLSVGFRCSKSFPAGMEVDVSALISRRCWVILNP